MTNVDATKVANLKAAMDNRFEKKANKKTSLTGDFSEDTDSYPTAKAVKDVIDTKANSADLAVVATSGSYTDLSNKPDLSSLGGLVTVEKQASAESGYAATYIVKQDDVQVGAKINIPKDFLVKSASMGTVATADTPVTGYKVGDKYLDFVINTKENDGTDEHIYINVADLIDVYTADESTLTLSGNTFSVKDGGITLTQLSTSVQTSLGYADAWNSSPAHGITNQNITDWNNKSELTTSDVDSEIEDYIVALTTALNQND